MICCNKTFLSIFWISFVLYLIIIPQIVSAQTTCADQLATSETLFYDGYFEAALVQVDNCLSNNTIDDGTKLKALILKAYIHEASAGEDLLLLQATLDAILVLNPDYSPDAEEVSAAFIELVESKKQQLTDLAIAAQNAIENAKPDSLHFWDLALSATADTINLHLIWQPEPNGIPVVYYVYHKPEDSTINVFQLIDSLTISTLTLPLPVSGSTTAYQVKVMSKVALGNVESATISFLSPPPSVAIVSPPQKRSWLKWVGIGGGVLAAGATTAWLLTRDDGGSSSSTLEGPPALPNLVGGNQ